MSEGRGEAWTSGPSLTKVFGPRLLRASVFSAVSRENASEEDSFIYVEVGLHILDDPALVGETIDVTVELLAYETVVVTEVISLTLTARTWLIYVCQIMIETY
jgi:hypothetical protein